MMVPVTLVLDVDADAWAAGYGIDPGRVSRDVQSYVGEQVLGSFAAAEGLIREVDVVWSTEPGARRAGAPATPTA